MTDVPSDPHSVTPSVRFGPPLEDANAAVVLVHGRGDSPRGILSLAEALDVPGVTFIAPQAMGFSWYPLSFMAPQEDNEPWLTSALARVGAAHAEAMSTGLPPGKTVLMGFSQGACLSLEFAARNAQRYGAVVAFSGGLMGPEGTEFDYAASLGGTPIFLGCSDVDFHIPKARVDESAEVMELLEGQVDKRIYPGMAHTVNADELEWARAILVSLATTS
jgi:phospholipase/carboxylesterase